MTIRNVTPTLILIILDESGSMQTKKSDVLGGYANFLKEQKALGIPCRMSLTKFNTAVTVVHSPQPIEMIPDLTEETYTPGGNTALYDAIANTVRLADKEKQHDERVLCLVMTDGLENSSRETTLQQIQEIIKAREAGGMWTFAYIGEQPDKWATETGTSRGSTMTYAHATPRASFTAASAATRQYRVSTESRTDTFFQQPPTTEKK